MILKYFYDKKLAQASYLLGCAATGEAMVIDPMRDIAPYLKAAKEEGLHITHVTETHIHADFVSGIREVAHATGAHMFLSDMGDENWKYAFADQPNVTLVRDGDEWMVGNVRVQVLRTDGHTPEHVSFMITDTAATHVPFGVFTGDFLFVGDVGRPDLLEEAAGMIGSKEIGARAQFHSVQRFKQLPDHLQIFPAHGAGSACGKALGALPSTTLGYEKLVNPAFQFDDEDDFVAWLLEGQPEAPRYFARMKYVNKVGSPLVSSLPQPQELPRAELDRVLAEGHWVFDMRSAQAFAEAHVAGTINVPNIGGGCVNHIGWFVDYSKPTYIIADREELPSILNAFRAIGIDDVRGYWTPDVIQPSDTYLPTIHAQEVARKRDEVVVVDVRGINEYKARHIAGAQHIPLGFLPKYLDVIPQDKPVVLQCASGYRSQIAASLLRRHGFDNVLSLVDGEAVWSQVLETEQG